MVIETLDTELKGAITERHAFRGDETAVVGLDRLLDVAALLKKEGFLLLVDITAVDWPQRPESHGQGRFDLVYHWLNPNTQERVRIKAVVAEDQWAPSLVGLFKTADWYEREVFDMFGIPFTGHPDLRRLLTWEDFPGHALRKDFPLDGGDAYCMADSTAPYNNGTRS